MGGDFIPNIKVPKTPARKKSSKTVRRKGSGGKGRKHKSTGGKRNKVAGKKRYVMHFWILDVDSHASKIYVRKNPANIFIQKILYKIFAESLYENRSTNITCLVAGDVAKTPLQQGR